MMFQLIVESGPASVAVSAERGSDVLSIVTVGLGVVVLFVLGYAFHRVLRAMRRPDLHGLDRKKIATMWGEIIKTSEHGLMGAKLAVIEADKLLDGAMRSMMIPGQTMGERLKAASYKYPSINKVWWAHKLRNQLAHDSTFQVSERQAKSALADFEAALKVLNVL